MTGKRKGGRAVVDTVACNECGRWCWHKETSFETIGEAAGEALTYRSCTRMSDVEKGVASRIWVLEKAV